MAITKAPRVRIYNASGATIPARSFVQVDADRARGDHRVYDVVKPDGTGLVYLVTENRDIASTEYGVAYNPISPVPVTHSSAPSTVTEVGPAASSWECDPDGTGFAAMRVSGDYTYVQSLGGGECTCKEIWRFTPLAPSAGTWDADITVNSSTETLTFNWNTTAAQMETELLTHTELTSGDVSCEGGPFPTVAIYAIWAITDSDVQTGYPVIDESSLTGNVVMDKFSTNSL